jgi:hypothetical protein
LLGCCVVSAVSASGWSFTMLFTSPIGSDTRYG